MIKLNNNEILKMNSLKSHRVIQQERTVKYMISLLGTTWPNQLKKPKKKNIFGFKIFLKVK